MTNIVTSLVKSGKHMRKRKKRATRQAVIWSGYRIMQSTARSRKLLHVGTTYMMCCEFLISSLYQGMVTFLDVAVCQYSDNSKSARCFIGLILEGTCQNLERKKNMKPSFILVHVHILPILPCVIYYNKTPNFFRRLIIIHQNSFCRSRTNIVT
jgi:hypothetical protein